MRGTGRGDLMGMEVQGNARRVADMEEDHICPGREDLEGGLVQEVVGWLEEA